MAVFDRARCSATEAALVATIMASGLANATPRPSSLLLAADASRHETTSSSVEWVFFAAGAIMFGVVCIAAAMHKGKGKRNNSRLQF